MRKAAPDSLYSDAVILGNCFSRACRLTSKADFKSVFDQSQKVTVKGAFALFRPNGGDHPRLGVIVSKHQVRRAVDRNRLKRLVRESFRQALELQTSFDIIVMVRKDWIAMPNTLIREELVKLWQRLSSQRKLGPSAFLLT